MIEFIRDSTIAGVAVGDWTLKDYIQLVIFPLLAYFDRRIDGISKKVDILGAKLEENTQNTKAIQITLIGVDGQNGLRSRIRRLERKVEYYATAIARLTGLAPLIPEDDEDKE